MKLQILGDYEPFDEKIVSIDKWYDRHTKLWIIQCLNKDGYQVGNAFYSPRKGAEIEYKRLKKEYNIE
jgi:hypothetical protein